MEPLPIDGRLRKAALRMPDEIEEASGFTLFGRRIKSLIYTTDVAVIRNSNADAVFAVYPSRRSPPLRSAADRRRVPGLCRRGRRNYDR
ncbi:MAG: hypothetical protein ACLU0O_09780 [Collinsella sp.]